MPQHQPEPVVGATRPPQSLTEDELGLHERSVRFYRQITDVPGRLLAITRGRKRNAASSRLYHARQPGKGNGGLQVVAREMISLRNLPPLLAASEAELRRFPLFLSQLVDELCCGNSTRTEAELVFAEGEAEARENRLTDELAHLGETPARLLAAADADEHEASILQERARARRRRARMLERQWGGR